MSRPTRYVHLLTTEQSDITNDLIRRLAQLRHEDFKQYEKGIKITKGRLTAEGSWHEHKDNPLQDILIVRFTGLTTITPPEQRGPEPATLADNRTVLVGDVTMSPEEL